MKTTGLFCSALSALALMGGAGAALAQDEITVAYFQEWPMPFQFAKVNGTYEEKLGTKINWVAFDSGTAMSAAMAAGDVQIAVSQGVPPFVVATSAGQDLKMVDVAVSYSENDNCVVSSDLEIDKTNTDELVGKQVAVPIGTAAHYGFLKLMEHFEIDPASMSIVDMAPAEGAAAFAQGSVDMACGWGGALRRMKEHGNVLLTGAEKEELGILVFDVTSAPADFVSEHADLLTKFIAVTAEANTMWNSGEHTDEMLPIIAKDAGMEVDAAADTLANFVFPDIEGQLSEKWLGGGVGDYLMGVAQVFQDTNNVPSILDDYAQTVDTSLLESINK